jgi:hypothetical protein
VTLSQPTQSGEERSGQSLLTSDHYVIVSIGEDTLMFEFYCVAHAGSMCKVNCPEGCESWSVSHESDTGHKLVSIDKCNFVEWMDATDLDYCALDGGTYAGPSFVLRCGPIEIEYSDGYTWTFIDDTKDEK